MQIQNQAADGVVTDAKPADAKPATPTATATTEDKQ